MDIQKFFRYHAPFSIKPVSLNYTDRVSCSISMEQSGKISPTGLTQIEQRWV